MCFSFLSEADAFGQRLVIITMTAEKLRHAGTGRLHAQRGRTCMQEDRGRSREAGAALQALSHLAVQVGKVVALRQLQGDPPVHCAAISGEALRAPHCAPSRQIVATGALQCSTHCTDLVNVRNTCHGASGRLGPVGQCLPKVGQAFQQPSLAHGRGQEDERHAYCGMCVRHGWHGPQRSGGLAGPIWTSAIATRDRSRLSSQHVAAKRYEMLAGRCIEPCRIDGPRSRSRAQVHDGQR